jgi:hypothetical protein
MHDHGPPIDRMCLSEEHHQQFFWKNMNRAKGRERRGKMKEMQWYFCICLNLAPLADLSSSIKQTSRVSVWCSHDSIVSSRLVYIHMVLLQVLGLSTFTWFYCKFEVCLHSHGSIASSRFLYIHMVLLQVLGWSNVDGKKKVAKFKLR